MRILLCSAVLLICHKASSLPSLLNVSKLNEDNFEKFGISKSNNYFQGTQIFNTYNITVNTPSGNITRDEKNQTIQNVQTVQIVKIPEFYTLTPGIGAHRLLVSKKSWVQARKFCFTEGAHLVVITSAEEEAVIKKLLSSQMIDTIWLGIHKLFVGDEWMTIFDHPIKSLEYPKWKVGEPREYKNTPFDPDYFAQKRCASYYKDGMKSVECSQENGFVCKINV